MWLLKHYQKDKNDVINKMEYFINEKEHKHYTEYFYLFNKNSANNYVQALKLLEEENESNI